MIPSFGRMTLLFLMSCAAVYVQSQSWLAGITQPKDYVQKRVSSYDRTGGNQDYRSIEPGQTLTIFDESGPGTITHIWFTFASDEMYHLKKLVFRMYWDGETTPSVRQLRAQGSATLPALADTSARLGT